MKLIDRIIDWLHDTRGWFHDFSELGLKREWKKYSIQQKAYILLILILILYYMILRS